MGVPIF